MVVAMEMAVAMELVQVNAVVCIPIDLSSTIRVETELVVATLPTTSVTTNAAGISLPPVTLVAPVGYLNLSKTIKRLYMATMAKFKNASSEYQFLFLSRNLTCS